MAVVVLSRKAGEGHNDIPMDVKKAAYDNNSDEYNKIKEYLLNRKEKVLQMSSMILRYNVDIGTYNMIMDNIITNLNYFEKLLQEKAIMEKNKQNAGYVDALHMLIALAIIIAFSICIAYLLYSTI